MQVVHHNLYQIIIIKNMKKEMNRKMLKEMDILKDLNGNNKNYKLI
jgi:hypothetical protein